MYDIDPMDIDPDTGRPYSNYSSPSLDTSFHDHEMAIDDPEPPLVVALRDVRRKMEELGVHESRLAIIDEEIAKHLEPEPDFDGCSNPGGHKWAYTGTAYGGDDESYHGEGRCYCEHCGADGDA